MFKSPKKHELILALVVVIVSIAELVSCRRMSFKESLTALAENDEEPQAQQEGHYHNFGNKAVPQPASINLEEAGGRKKLTKGGVITSNEKRIDERDSAGTSLPYSTSAIQLDKITNGFPSPSWNNPGTTQTQFSLWELTKNMLHSFQQKGSRRFITNSSSDSVNDGGSFGLDRAIRAGGVTKSTHIASSQRAGTHPLIPTKEMPEQQGWNNFLTTMKNEAGAKMGDSSSTANKNIAAYWNSSNRTKSYLKDLEAEEQERAKKEVGSNAGLQDLLWNTGRALWSVNKEHFLPTFLHTKTGGKLSLIRDSIFKPITILSQFRSGVKEINNEKLRNLARLSSGGGTGWSSPGNEVVVLKWQEQNTRLLTLLRYMLRLTKHTVITKYKLKRAILDLQFRALQKLIRILSSKNIAKKIATIKILTNAAWKGKRAFLRILTGAAAGGGGYSGKDNSVNVDLTYSSLGSNSNSNDYKDSGGWITNSYSYSSATPPPPPAPYQDSYRAPSAPPSSPADSYLPQSAPPSSPAIHTNYYHNPAHSPPLPLFPPSPSLSYTPPTSEPLIETPSYANVLKIMGININPPSPEYKYGEPTTSTTASPFLYYSSKGYDGHNHHQHGQHSQSYTIPLIQKPSASYAYHYSSPSSPQSYNSNNDLSLSPSSSFSAYVPTGALALAVTKPGQEPSLISGNKPFFQNLEMETSKEPNNDNGPRLKATTPPTAFRLKLLEAMSLLPADGS